VETICSRYKAKPTVRAAWFAEVFELCPLLDGSLSLLLCLLPKIKHLHLELTSEHRLPMTLELLAGLTLQDSSDIDTERSFGQIRNLTVKSVSGPACVFPITLRAGMKEVHIDGNRDFCLHGGINPARLNYDSLRSISLRSTDVHPGVLEEAIQSSILRNLETLIVDGVGRCDLGSYKRRSWLGFDYRKLKQVMLQNLPKLRCFGWTGMAYRTGWNDRLEPFGSFAGFPYLDSLYIDYKLLFDVVEDQPQNELPDLCLLPFMLPPKLRQFRIYGITWAVVQEIYTAYLEASDTGSGALDEFLWLMSRLPLKVVALTIDMSSWPHDHQMADWQEFAIDEPATHLLRSISDSWMKVGVDLWAEYRMVEWHERPRALVYSGFTASSVMYDGYEATSDKRGNRRLEEARAEANVEELSDGESEIAGDEVDGDEARGEESEVAGDEVDKSQESEVAAGNL
jgi:hypothetical protein